MWFDPSVTRVTLRGLRSQRDGDTADQHKPHVRISETHRQFFLLAAGAVAFTLATKFDQS